MIPLFSRSPKNVPLAFFLAHACLTVFSSSSHPERVKLDAGAGESVHREQPRRPVAAVASIWERYGRHAVLPRYLQPVVHSTSCVCWCFVSGFMFIHSLWKYLNEYCLFFQLHRGNHLIKLTCMMSEDDHGGVYAFQNCSFFLGVNCALSKCSIVPLLQVHPGSLIPQRYGHSRWRVSDELCFTSLLHILTLASKSF